MIINLFYKAKWNKITWKYYPAINMPNALDITIFWWFYIYDIFISQVALMVIYTINLITVLGGKDMKGYESCFNILNII